MTKSHYKAQASHGLSIFLTMIMKSGITEVCYHAWNFNYIFLRYKGTNPGTDTLEKHVLLSKLSSVRSIMNNIKKLGNIGN